MPKSTVPIAVVLSLSYSYCRQVLRGIRLYAKDKSWMLYPIVMQPDLRRVLIDLKPAGVIAYAFNQEVARALHGIDLPVVNVSRADPKLTFPQVNIEESSIGTMVAEHLIGCGLRHFGYFGPSRFGPESGREGGFYKGLKRIPHTISVCHTQPSLFDPSDTTGSAENTREWVRSLPKPVGVFTPNDIWGIWLSDICRQEGIRVPEEVAIVGVDNDELLCEIAQPSLSSVAIPSERVGYEAAQLLEKILAGTTPPSEPVLLPPLGLVVRKSSDVLAVDDPDLAAAIHYIRANAWQPICVNDILDQVAVSRRSLERKFRDLLGHSPNEEVRRLRVEKAKSLLLDTDLKMAEVARRSGFSSDKQLSTVFLQVTGSTPSAFRRQNGCGIG